MRHPPSYTLAMFADTEPTLVTDPAAISVLDELLNCEPIIHRPELGTTRAEFENMTVPDFRAVGAYGDKLRIKEERAGGRVWVYILWNLGAPIEFPW